MTRNEYETLLRKIESIYPTFSIDEDEWWNVLNKYSYKEVLNNLQKYKGNIPPLYTHLNRGLKEETKNDPVYMQCDICGELVKVADEWEVFDNHHRKCEKIDFIDRQAKLIHGKGITKSIYYKMTNEELEDNYRQYMNNWVKNNQDIAYNPSALFKKL